MIILKVPIVILIIAVVTLQTFTRGKSFYLGKISLGKFTSGFIIPMLKGHTGENLDFGRFNVTNNHILARVFKILAQNGKHAREQTNQREVFIISLLFITLFQRATRARLILLQCLIFQRIQRLRRAAFSQFLTVFAWRQQRRPKRVA